MFKQSDPRCHFPVPGLTCINLKGFKLSVCKDCGPIAFPSLPGQKISQVKWPGKMGLSLL